jgi:hypothetical protein
VKGGCVGAPSGLSVAATSASGLQTKTSISDGTGGFEHDRSLTTCEAVLRLLSLVEQHRLYDALAEPLADGTIHELRIRTKGSQ